ncbi:hypothetical protein VTK56DRAFT_6979 [Thermocarpiscus australiensis]
MPDMRSTLSQSRRKSACTSLIYFIQTTYTQRERNLYRKSHLIHSDRDQLPKSPVKHPQPPLPIRLSPYHVALGRISDNPEGTLEATPRDKWLFLMDGVISFPVAIASFIFLPDLPETNSRKFFTDEKRMALEERKTRAPFTLKKVLKVFSSWHIYLLSLYCIPISGTSGTPIFPQYLKYHENPKYTVAHINLYPSGLFAIQAPSCTPGSRMQSCVDVAGPSFSLARRSTSSASAPWPPGLSGIVFTWANEICTSLLGSNLSERHELCVKFPGFCW